MKNTVYSFLPREVINCSEILGEELHNHCRMLLGFERAKGKEGDYLARQILTGKNGTILALKIILYWNVKDRVGLG